MVLALLTEGIVALDPVIRCKGGLVTQEFVDDVAVNGCTHITDSLIIANIEVGKSDTAILEMVDELRNLSLSQSEEPFPWNQLPRELQVKILQSLRRCDIETCLLVDREMYDLIRSNEGRMRRRVIDELLIMGNELRANCFEEELCKSNFVEEDELFPFTTSVTSFLLETLRNCDVAHLRIFTLQLTDDLLSSILSGLLDTGCRVRELSMEGSSMDAVTSTTFLRFLREVAPAKINLDLSTCHQNLFSREVLEFIVTRQYFFIDYGNVSKHYPLPVDDDILDHLTAPDFLICAPNMITIGGLKSFMKDLIDGRRKVTDGTIYTTFPLDGLSNLTAALSNLKLESIE